MNNWFIQATKECKNDVIISKNKQKWHHMYEVASVAAVQPRNCNSLPHDPINYSKNLISLYFNLF